MKTNPIQTSLLAAALLALPVATQAQFYYTVNPGNTNVTITGYTGAGGVVAIPSTINVGGTNLPVVSIGDDAFSNKTNITSVTIPDSVTSIGYLAFNGCWRLTNVTIGSGVTNIGEYAFAYLGSLIAITVDTQNSFYSSVNGVLFDKSQSTLIQFPNGISGSYTIPDSAASIGDGAFWRCSSLTSVTIPNSVTNIGDYAFDTCLGLTSVTIGNSVTSIGDYAFYSCFGLTSVTIPDGVKTIGAGAFTHSGLTNITIPSSVDSIGGYVVAMGFFDVAHIDGAFTDCPLISATIGDGVRSIGDGAFAGTPLTSVTIPGSVTNIGDYAFFSCYGLTSVTISGSAASIGDGAFWRCSSLTSVTIPNSVTSIGDWAFLEGYSLTNVTIGNGVTHIGDGAFVSCYSLTSVMIPKSVTSIGWYAFDGCDRLTSAFFDGDAPSFGDYVFAGVISDPVTVYHLLGATGWDSVSLNVPVTLWLPQVLTGDGKFGVRTNQFGFNIAWASGQTVVVEAATNLSNPNWIPVATHTLASDSVYFSDPRWTNYPARFYRLRSP